MSGNFFDEVVDSPTILESKKPLTDNWEPDTIREREEQIDQIVRNLSFVFDDEAPVNFTIFGGTGAGKTVVTQRIVEDMAAKAEELNEELDEDEQVQITPIRVSCRDLTTTYKLALKLENTVAELVGEDGMSRGVGTNEVMDSLMNHLDTLGGTVLFILDEVHKAGGDADEVLYALSRAGTDDGANIDTDIGLIMIAPDTQFQGELDDDTMRTLDPDPIKFGPYNARELQSILMPRAEIAFSHDAFPGFDWDAWLEEDESEGGGDFVDTPGPVQLAAAHAAQDEGNASQALSILLTAGKMAESEGSEKVTDDHVDRAKERVESRIVSRAIKPQKLPAKLGMAALLEFEAAGETPVSTSPLYTVYQQIVEFIADDGPGSGSVSALSKNRFRQHLDSLDERELVRSDLRAPGQGVFRIWELSGDVSVDVVREHLQDEPELSYLDEWFPLLETDRVGIDLPRVQDWE